MILVPRAVVLALLLVFCATIVGLGVYGYNAITDTPRLSETEARIRGERILYASFVAVVAVISVFLVFVGRSRNVSRELDKMIELNKIGDFSPELSMKKLGRLGEKITLLYFRLNALNEKKSLKISAMANLIEFLNAHIELPVLITNVLGSVVYVNKSCAEKLDVTRSEILNTDVQHIVSTVEFQDIVGELDRRNVSIEREIEGRELSLFPVNNRMNELTYIVWFFERPRVVAEITRGADAAVRSSRVPNLIKRMFSRRDDPKMR